MQLCFPVSVPLLSHRALLSNARPCQLTSVKFDRGDLGSKILILPSLCLGEKKSLVSATSPWLGAFVVQRDVMQQPLCEKSFHWSSCLMGLLSSTALGLKHLEELLLHFFWFLTKVSASE